MSLVATNIKQLKSTGVIFYRDFQEYTGGHQKVADYFQHLKTSVDFSPYIGFSPQSKWDLTNPWFPEYQQQSVDYLPANYKYAFLAGLDWQTYLNANPPANQPIINLIQHVRHADPVQPMHAFLKQKAVRICVSKEVEAAVLSTGLVNGPVFTIDNGIDIPPIAAQVRQHQVFIFGPKNPELAKLLSQQLTTQGIDNHCVVDWVPRDLVLKSLASSRIALLLPNTTEGFYLPALESMCYAELTIVPDCVGNRSFCHNRQNCLFPAYNTPALSAAVTEALSLLRQPEQLNIFKRNCAQTLAYHSLARERAQFLDLIRQLDSIWASI
ncbi:glycosyltransferase family 1 protein [Cellvibrio sp. KY-GH-1]|uniref:glycosyltransferase n=1 Tax=Cellvibrio sp. KY-GH-1 TaxID=2303332 RepID=UPI0012486CDC|nr:glycosyltransferase [Cellvibrio sp. KY-GH-1]QEY17326.1 glycosyltransferase family 1 protein [Cellvibrio sp. KY-GH-1]